LIQEVRNLGFDVIVSDGSDQCVCRNLADVFVPVDIFDIEGHLREAKVFTARGNKIAAVLAAGIDAPETMAALAEMLGLPSVDRKIAHLVNNRINSDMSLNNSDIPLPDLQLWIKGYCLIWKAL
jgi:hypothetical protein